MLKFRQRKRKRTEKENENETGGTVLIAYRNRKEGKIDKRYARFTKKKL